MEFLEHIVPNLIIGIENESHHPDPVFPYIKPTMGVHILFHIMISMVQFKTKIYFIANNTLREILCYAKYIGSSNEPGEIVGYSNALICWFIKEQLSFFPDSKIVIDGWIIIGGELFDSIIINNDFLIIYMLSVQQTTLFVYM